MVGSVSSSTSDVNTVNLQDFKDGKVNISKSELKSSVSEMIAQGEEPSDVLLDIVDSYDKIDTNDDGISYKELETYKSTPAGIISSLGLSVESMKRQQLNLFASTFLQDDSTSSSSLFGSTDSSESYLNSLIQSYSSSDSTDNSNIFDFIS